LRWVKLQAGRFDKILLKEKSMNERNTIRAAEILSVLGAGVLGAGLALVAPAGLLPHAGWLLALGLIAHSAGMYTKHRAESRAGLARARWEKPFYWACWLALAALGGYLILRVATA
jgi:hypothetical protein